MKTAISIPDEIFRKAEQHARRTKKSRSELYKDAISEYLSRHAPDAVTEAMNKVLAGIDEPIDPFVAGAGRRILKRARWYASLREMSAGQTCERPRVLGQVFGGRLSLFRAMH